MQVVDAPEKSSTLLSTQCHQTIAMPPNPPQLKLPLMIRERRWWLVLLALWSGVIGLAFWLHVETIRQQTEQVAIEGARNMFRMVILTRNWNSLHGGVYVPITEETQPNPYLKHPKRDVMTTNGIALTMVNPAYMTRLIGEIAKSDSGAIFRLTSLKPIRPANAPDDWERSSLIAFEQGSKETTSLDSSGPDTLLRYMAPLPVENNCLKCHAEQGYKVGDVRGGISVSQRYAPIEAAARIGIRESAASYLAVFLLVAGLGWALLELLRRRWFELAGTIRELEETQSQLLQSEKMASIGQLAAGVAHEINNPVGFVNSNFAALKRYTEQLLGLVTAARAGQASEADYAAADFDFMKDDIADLVRESQEGLDRVKKIVSNLKDFSHVDEAEWQDADLNAGIDSTLSVAWHELKYKAEVRREYSELPRVPCMPAQINQVILNLLVNAAHAIEERGVVSIRTGHDGQQAWIEISDTGKGMAPETLKRIFEPFYTTKPVGKGTGLGLSLSYDIVKKHGGQIEVSSEPGRGSTFRIVLPLKRAAA